MKNFKLSKKMIVGIVIVVFIVGSVLVNTIKGGISDRNEQKEKERLEEKATELLKDKVEVPDTFMKSKEEVTLIFKELGLKAEFVVRDMEEVANKKAVFIKIDMCDSIQEAPNVKYYGPNEVGYDHSGYYLDKGATVIVGYSDRDIDATKKEDDKNPITTPSEEKPSTETSPDTSDNTGVVSADIANKVTSINGRFDDMIAKVNGYIAAPDTYSSLDAISFLQDYTKIFEEYAELSDLMNAYEGQITAWEHYDIWMGLANKSLELTNLFAQLPK